MAKSKASILVSPSGLVENVIFQRNGVVRIRPKKYKKYPVPK